MRLEASQQDPTRPVLVIGNPSSSTPTAPSDGPSTSLGSSTRFELRLHPCLPPSAFPMNKLAPDRNCVRAVQQATPPAGMAAGGTKPQAVQQRMTDAEQDALLLPTPVYNAGVVADCCVLAHAAVLQRALHGNAKLADGLLLLKVRRRCYA